MSRYYLNYQEENKDAVTLDRINAEDLDDAKKKAAELWQEIEGQKKIRPLESGEKCNITDDSGIVKSRRIGEHWYDDDFLKDIETSINERTAFNEALAANIGELNDMYDAAVIKLASAEKIPPRPYVPDEPKLPTVLGTGYSIFTSKENKAAFKAHQEWQEKKAVIEQEQAEWDTKYEPRKAFERQTDKFGDTLKTVEIYKKELVENIAKLRATTTKLKKEMVNYRPEDKALAEKVLKIAENYIESAEKVVEKKPKKDAEIER